MKTFHKAPLALAVTALMMAPYAMGGGPNGGGGNDFETNSSIDSEFDNKIDVELTHDSDTYKNFKVRVKANVTDPADYAGATVDSKQLINNNGVTNDISTNNASVDGNALGGAAGNIGVNVAAGDNNQQANDGALAASDAANVFGQAAAFAAQSTSNNIVTNSGSPNNASVGGSALAGATGNVGVNVAAGNMNAQQNSLAAASNTGSSGSVDATAGGVQTTYNNYTSNEGTTRHEYEEVGVSLSGGMGGGYVGVGAGGYEGTWNQTNDVYPESWVGGDEGDSHPTSSQYWGHIDYDNDGPDDGKFEGSESGGLAFLELGAIGLEGAMSGTAITKHTVYVANENNASLGGSALAGASGNIGVNIAAGSNNLQRNSLAIASSIGGGNGFE